MTTEAVADSDLAAAVRATVAYSDVFDMPIHLDDLGRFIIGTPSMPAEIAVAVDRLVLGNQLVRVGDLVHLPGRSNVIAIHGERTRRAATMWPQAERWGRRIGRVPFVRMVAVTGGLAVDSVAAHDDIDYFIVTRPGRLWLTRLMIVVLARLAARADIDLCPNYIVSDRHFDMAEHTVYVARELAQMVVVVGSEQCADIRRRNDWMFDFLPNASIEGDLTHAIDREPHRLQLLAERFLMLKPFAAIERWEMRRKIARLTNTASRRPEVGTPDESSFTPDVCKGHIVGNAAGIDAAWTQRLSGFGVNHDG